LRPLLAASPEGPDKNKQQIREDHKDYDASDDDKSDQNAPHDALRTVSTNSGHETVTQKTGPLGTKTRRNPHVPDQDHRQNDAEHVQKEETILSPG
jgi:hypothetical protein